MRCGTAPGMYLSRRRHRLLLLGANEERWLTVRDVCGLLGVKERKVQRWVLSSELEVGDLGRRRASTSGRASHQDRHMYRQSRLCSRRTELSTEPQHPARSGSDRSRLLEESSPAMRYIARSQECRQPHSVRRRIERRYRVGRWRRGRQNDFLPF